MKRKHVEIWCAGILALLAAFTLGFLVGSHANRADVTVSVPEVQPAAYPAQAAEAVPSEEAPEAEPTGQGVLDLNTATQEELETLPGIGEVLAQRILAYRSEFGPFLTEDQIMEVDGIGEKRYEALKEWITVEETNENSGS